MPWEGREHLGISHAHIADSHPKGAAFIACPFAFLAMPAAAELSRQDVVGVHPFV